MEVITEKTIYHVKKCPLGVLTYYMNNEPNPPIETAAESIVEVMPKGR
jgi:hypothetical protein